MGEAPPTAAGELTAGPGVKTSRAAVSSLVLGVLGFCTAGVTGLAGLIVGLVALGSIGRSEGRVGGQGFAVAGLATSGASILFGCVSLGLLLPALAQGRDLAKNLKGQVQARVIAETALEYAYDHDGLLPLDDWESILVEQSSMTPGLSNLPHAPGEGRVLAFNENLRGVDIRDIESPSQTVLLFECTAGSPPAGGIELLPDPPRHRLGCIVVTVGGSVEARLPELFEDLVWEP